MQDVLSEPCKPWPTRRDDYVTAACWIHSTTPDPVLPHFMTPFKPLFGHSSLITFDILVPQANDTKETGDLYSFSRTDGTYFDR